ncbi:hypothetical protein AMECASPLE_030411 [Ameca splendens]|uniref:Uncharacterized protein n=1 Tax=Ameca splendens TaxID=208324 RepID=A0ABV0YT18_9TELE
MATILRKQMIWKTACKEQIFKLSANDVMWTWRTGRSIYDISVCGISIEYIEQFFQCRGVLEYVLLCVAFYVLNNSTILASLCTSAVAV